MLSSGGRLGKVETPAAYGPDRALALRAIGLLIVTLCIFRAIGTGATSPSRLPTAGWKEDALETARRLVQGMPPESTCGRFEVFEFSEIAESYRNRLPLPEAMARCVGKGEEDITIEVFADGDARDVFLASKLYVMCHAVGKRVAMSVRFPYVEGPNWLVEPDEEDTAARWASTLGGAFKTATCPRIYLSDDSPS